MLEFIADMPCIYTNDRLHYQVVNHYFMQHTNEIYKNISQTRSTYLSKVELDEK